MTEPTKLPNNGQNDIASTSGPVDCSCFGCRLADVQSRLIQTALDAEEIPEKIKEIAADLTDIVLEKKRKKPVGVKTLLDRYGTKVKKLPAWWKVYTRAEVELIVSTAVHQTGRNHAMLKGC